MIFIIYNLLKYVTFQICNVFNIVYIIVNIIANLKVTFEKYFYNIFTVFENIMLHIKKRQHILKIFIKHYARERKRGGLEKCIKSTFREMFIISSKISLAHNHVFFFNYHATALSLSSWNFNRDWMKRRVHSRHSCENNEEVKCQCL